MRLRTCAALFPRPERLGFGLGRDDGGVAVGTEDAAVGVEALDGEEVQAGSGGGAIDARRLSGVALVVDSVSIGFGGAAEGAVEAMSSGVASSVAG